MHVGLSCERTPNCREQGQKRHLPMPFFGVYKDYDCNKNMKHEHCTRLRRRSESTRRRRYDLGPSSPVLLVGFRRAQQLSTVPHSTCACIHVDLHVCSPCQSLPHSARLSGSSAQSLKMPDSARNSAGIIRRPPGTCLGNLRKTKFGYHVCVCEQIHALGFHDRALYLGASGTL